MYSAPPVFPHTKVCKSMTCRPFIIKASKNIPMPAAVSGRNYKYGY